MKTTLPRSINTHIQHSNMNVPRTIISNTTSTTATTTPQACAACKYQRRKCTSDCLLAPYFPHDRTRQFLNAHKLFGVSNITKILKNLIAVEKDEAMRTIIFQSDARALDPVGGCHAIICGLQQQIEYCRAELDLVLNQLAICRAQAAYSQQSNQFQETNAAIDDSTTLNCDQLVVNAESLEIYDKEDQQQLLEYQNYVQVQQPSLNPKQDFYVVQENNSISTNLDRVQENSLQEEQAVSTWSLQESSVSSTSPHSLHVKLQYDFVNDQCGDDYIKPLLDINDVKFEADELVERKFVRPSTPRLVTSS